MLQEYKSTETRIVLRNVDLTTSGKFRCEVSGEAPLFQTATFTNVLIVVGEFTQGCPCPPWKDVTDPLLALKDVLMSLSSSSLSCLNTKLYRGADRKY